jgi:hypothetical protein
MSVFGKVESAAWISTIAICLGCQSGPKSISIPTVDAGTAAAGAIELADKDGDGAISKEEAVATPSLKTVFEKYDVNTDGRLDAAEIESQIASWYAKTSMVIPIRFTVKMDGRPLTGAKVVLEPEPFVGVDIPEGVSEVDSTGASCQDSTRNVLWSIPRENHAPQQASSGEVQRTNRTRLRSQSQLQPKRSAGAFAVLEVALYYISAGLRHVTLASR